MTPVVPRIGNDVSYARTIKQSSHFSWQAQYLVRLDGDTSVAPRTVNDVSYAMRTKYVSLSA